VIDGNAQLTRQRSAASRAIRRFDGAQLAAGLLEASGNAPVAGSVWLAEQATVDGQP
jgi:hypothetical protein